MKKRMLAILLVIVLLGLTGCGASNSTLTCTNSQVESGMGIDSEAKISFKNDKVSNLVLTMTISAQDETMKDSWALLESAIASQYDAVSKDGLKVSTKTDSDNYKLVITIEADPKKATKEDLEEYGMSSLAGATDTMEQVQKDLEAEGFTCKK